MPEAHFFGGPLDGEIVDLHETPDHYYLPHIDNEAFYHSDLFSAEPNLHFAAEIDNYEIQFWNDSKGRRVYLFTGTTGATPA